MKRAFACKLIMAVAAAVAVAKSGGALEAVAHVIGYHIIHIAYSREHSLCTEFLCKGDEAAFCNVDLEAVAVDVAVAYLPVKWVKSVFWRSICFAAFCESRSDMSFLPCAEMALERSAAFSHS